ncbi:MAG: hypothetical protein QF921_12960 [Pseudomonadales bacterium]|mgnify:CR=1 FL=1|nr:hypothetical protein [Pseudomonadales bacterium]MDP6470265.1 hypothetical protein [Pseudomonadales bacterium]MDP6827171.1 hypothetical protein [Pseudomonadales bacterium]MDP6972398.1 hypothetical protein [Pseudomonadales bacterium]|tara:strand:+ start:1736 stop:2254 length:519 start_codon:yes stop_codon:yes gene_type:complete
MDLTAFVASNFLYIKFIHVFFAFLWGLAVPPAYTVYVRRAINDYQGEPSNAELERRMWWSWDQVDKLIILEHIAWPVLIITGPLMFLASGWTLESTWIMLKLSIIVIIYVPLEAYDIWFSHYYSARAEARKEEDPEGYKKMRGDQLKFFRFVSPVVRITIPLLWFLAIVKPG